MRRWLIGLANAAISALATTAGTIVAGTTLKQSLAIVGFSFAVSLLKWMAQHPIPGGLDE